MNPSTALAAVVVDSLVRLGLRHVVLCPGSRSAPLAYALAAAEAAGRLHLHVRIDERSAAFCALGLAKALPDGLAAVVTTSGTAVANLHPAVLEAHHARVPLLVLTADRPHEVRGSGANQTSDLQAALFGAAVRLAVDVPAAEERAGQAPGWRSALSRLVAAARGTRGGDPGPVHANLGFREPLTPDGDLRRPEDVEGTAGLTEVVPGAAPAAVPLEPGPRTVVVAGDGAGAAAGRLAAEAGWPLLAEPSSGARCGAAVGPYRLLLEEERLGRRIERVVVVGRPTLSRPVSRLLARADVEVVVVSPGGAWPDAGFRARRVLAGVAAPARTGDGGWLDAWAGAGRAAAAAVDSVLDGLAVEGVLTGPLVAREVAAAAHAGPGALVVAASNAVRDLDLAGAPGPAPVFASRGLAGIDGTVSTASGVALAAPAAAGGAPTRLLVGDLAFLHDVNGLLVGPGEVRPDLQVVLVNDDGGGIFELLEHADAVDRAVFERVFGTPHGADVAALCRGYGVAHRLVPDLAGLRAALAAPPAGTSVVEVRLDRARVRPVQQRIAAAVREAVA
ncbi:2-succinyl-5-enolpyruvyl-6-hydroxy-3-cyclohexene-1-carboxylate synthase [Kineococcus xinjiangensis]|uniref:2-succinyl-5-enolpyruvyl-6-hydroxy-3-cyclohexene-1-carboxylate synthase n=1 Tax=Kineococcus xinjiangensis TaxID=512762 RepID=A0A2S6ITB3_9ACTN|nr:2-succinyl-5-enolpyruvyl-6-hydroxy-3-cyclohexene-1-carboxylic-acid synthase [Kineococcus xinjiangensis]PPK97492.1 2-succinyl-5-enolpyruvyl-6-hydroxy-3-cyclohexene-1-carboxylate synthase [Kineococcus xinjiangensis]